MDWKSVLQRDFRKSRSKENTKDSTKNKKIFHTNLPQIFL